MPRRKKKNTLNDQRNRVRGLISATKSTEVVLHKGRKGKDRTAKARQFQRALAGLLVDLRNGIGATQYENFLGWLERQASTQLRALRDISTLDSDLLKEVQDASPLPLEKEIQWIVARLVQHRDFISRFVISANKLEELFWIGDWAHILSQLNSIEKEFGRSLWLLEAKIALHQEFAGLEAQKAITKAERNLGARTLSAYIAFHVSVRNEPTTVIGRFLEEMGERVDRLNVEGTVKSFLAFKLADRSPVSSRDAANILQVAQGLAEVDLYESLIQVCQILVAHDKDAPICRTIRHALAHLGITNDIRTQAVLYSLDDQNAPEATETKAASNTTLKSSLRVLQRAPRNVPTAVRAAGLISVVKKDLTVSKPVPRWPYVIHKMALALQYGRNFDSDVDAIEKYFANHRLFSSAVACRHLFRAELSGDIVSASKERQKALLSLQPNYWVDVAINKSILPSPERFAGSEKVPRWVFARRRLADLRNASAQGDLQKFIQGISDLVLKRELPTSVLPLRETLGDAKWKHIKKLVHLPSLAIALHVCWRATDSDVAATNLRFAYDGFLDAHQLNTPVDLANQIGNFQREEIVYFLRHVCVPAVIDMSDRHPGSRDVEVARSNVCAELIKLDPEHATKYQDEVVSIVHSLSMREGQTLVDSSRVHVDVAAIRAWAGRELQPTFLRYSSLVAAGVGIAEDLETLLRKAFAPNRSAILEVPDSEADVVLVDLMLALREKFLLDPQHGLDSYLSRRVRHHSMTGYIRGPVELEKLITSKDSKNNRYAPNMYFVEKLGPKNKFEQATLVRAFETFAEEFDKVVLNLKNQLFHVQSEERPNGLFNFFVTVSMMHLARSVVQAEMSLDSLCRVCFSMFWQALDSSLKDAQHHLLVETKRELSSIFQRLRAALKRTADKERYEECSMLIARAAENVQREIDKMASWFVRKEIQQANQSYNLEKVLDIAIESALLSHRPFAPTIIKDVSCPYLVRTGDLIVVAEIVLTVLGNVKQHSGISSSPNVHIQIKADDDGGCIIIRVESDTGSSACSSLARERVDSIRRQIEDGTYIDKIRKEGGSGLMKLASIASQSSGNRLAFGFIDAHKFFVETRIRFLEMPDRSIGVVGRLAA